MFPSRSRRIMPSDNGSGRAGKQSWPRLGRNELPIFFQSALILIGFFEGCVSRPGNSGILPRSSSGSIAPALKRDEEGE